MVLDTGKITEEGLAKLRARLGTFVRPSFYGMGMFHTEATRDTIRHFCNGVGELNPLYRDEEYGRRTHYGTMLAPPTFLYSVYWCSGRVGGLPGVHGFHSGNDWEWLRPICVGDRFTVKEQFTDLVEKPSKFAGRMVLTYSLATYLNQRNEVVARCTGWQVRAERQAARERKKYEHEPHRYSPEELKEIEEATLNEQIRGEQPRFWDDVQVGDEIGPMVRGPLSHGDLYAFVAGCIGGLAHGTALREFKRHPAWGFRDPQTGTLEGIIRVHDIGEAAKGAGLPTAYDYGCQRPIWMGTLLTNWAGDHGFLKRLYAELRRFNYVGDATWLKGKVVGKRMVEGEGLVDIELTAENQRKELSAAGKAVVVLPARKPAGLEPLPF